MTIKSHIETLNKKHEKLDKKLHDAYTHYLPEAEIIELKKQKLKIKDEINSLNSSVFSMKNAA